MENTDKFKTRLKELRKEKNMRQEDLAKRLGIVRSAIANYETGRTIPDSETLNIIANILDTTTDYLLGRTNNPNPYNKDNSVVKESKEKYPKSNDLLEYVIEEAEKHGYNLRDKSKEEIAKIVVKALKIDEISKSN